VKTLEVSNLQIDSMAHVNEQHDAAFIQYVSQFIVLYKLHVLYICVLHIKYLNDLYIGW